MEKIEIALAIILASSLIAYSSAIAPSTAYFSDTEISTGNILSAWVEERPPECAIEVDAEDAKLTGNGLKLHHIEIENEGDEDIAIDKMNVSWVEDEGENSLRIKIGGADFWEGNGYSGEILDGEYVIGQNKTKKLQIWFDSNMDEKDIFIQFIFEGCGSKTIKVRAEREGKNCTDGDDDDERGHCKEDDEDDDGNGNCKEDDGGDDGSFSSLGMMNDFNATGGNYIEPLINITVPDTNGTVPAPTLNLTDINATSDNQTYSGGNITDSPENETVPAP